MNSGGYKPSTVLPRDGPCVLQYCPRRQDAYSGIKVVGVTNHVWIKCKTCSLGKNSCLIG